MQKVDNYPLFKQLFLLGKKVVLFPEIGRVKFFLSPTRPHKSNAYEYIYIYIYICIKKQTHKQKYFHPANLLVQIYVFSLQTKKRRAFSNKEKCS